MTWVAFGLATLFFAWSAKLYLDASGANSGPPAVAPDTRNADPEATKRRALEKEQATNTSAALSAPWPEVIRALEAIADDRTSVLRFEYRASTGETHVSARSDNFTSIQRSLERSRAAVEGRMAWKLAAISREEAATDGGLVFELRGTLTRLP